MAEQVNKTHAIPVVGGHGDYILLELDCSTHKPEYKLSIADAVTLAKHILEALESYKAFRKEGL